MNPTLLTITAFALVGVVPILLALYFAKRFRMPDYAFSYWIILVAVFFGITVVATSYQKIKLGIDLRGGSILVYEVSKSTEEQLEQDADAEAARARSNSGLSTKMDKLSSTLKKRLDPGGVKEITVRQQGSNAVEIIIPEVDPIEIARLKKIVSRSGTLAFRILADRTYPEDRQLIELGTKTNDAAIRIKTGVDAEGKDTYNDIGMWIPITPGQEGDFNFENYVTRTRTVRNKEVREVLCIKDIYNVTGDYLSDATPGIDQYGGHCVNFSFNADGANRFGKLTEKNTPNVQQNRYRHLGIILDGEMYSAPRINSKISDRGQITGGFSEEDANALATVLNSGSLPATLEKEPISEMTSGPTLGADTIHSGKVASAVALILVLIFMVYYYRFAGLVADFALVVNLLLLVALMITFSAAFTLPGIAGLVMTLGMAVDANVLIYERMREERDKGATIHMAIRNGFQKAFSAIFDSNITTLLVGVILYWVGTSQIKGFAVTLILGIALSMFTALFCARIIFETADKTGVIKNLRMRRIIGQTNIDFMGKIFNVRVVTAILWVICFAAILSRGNGLLDIDFTGGSSVQALFNEPVGIDVVRKELSELENLAVSDVQITGEQKGVRYMINSSSPTPKKGEKALEGEEYINYVTKLIQEKFPGKLVTNDVTIKNCVPFAEKDSVLPKEEKPAAPAEGEKAPEAAPAETTTLNSIFDLFTSTAYADEPAKEEAKPAEEAAPAQETPAEEAAPAEDPKAEEAAPAEEPKAEEAAPAEEPKAEEAAPAEEPKAEEAAPAEEPKAEEAAPAEEPKAEEAAPAQETPAEEAAPAQETPAEEAAPAQETPAEEAAPAQETPTEEAAPAQETPAEEAAPAEEPKAEEAAPAQETPTEEAAPAQETPTEEAAPAQETPAEEAAPAQETPAEEAAPAQETPAEEAAPAQETPAEEAAPAQETPAEEAAPAQETPAEEAAPAQETPAEEAAPAEETPAAPAEELEAPEVPAIPEPGINPVDDSAPPAEAANPEKAFDNGSFAVVEFKEPVSYDVVKAMIEDAMTAENVAVEQRDVLVENPLFEDDTTSAFNSWNVSFVLPPADAQKILERVKATAQAEPVFPARNMIGPQVAGDLRTKGMTAIFASLIVIVVYLWFRFQKIYYGYAATIALVNNVILSVGALAISAYVCGALGFLLIDPFKIGLTVLAGIMTIIGYSLNDTIVVFDRIREVKGKAPHITPAMVNQAINDMLARTILTSVTTLLVIVVLYVWGGQAIHAFAFTMLVGVVVGTLSSIFIAAPTLCNMDMQNAQRERYIAEIERAKRNQEND